MINKHILLANTPFVLVSFIIFIVGWLELVDFKILMPLMFICIGCQQLFIGLRFYKEKKEIKMLYVLCSIVCFVFAIFMILKM